MPQALGGIQALDARTGAPRWTAHLGSVGSTSTPAAGNGLLVAGTSDGVLGAFDLQTGTALFQRARAPITAAPALRWNNVYFPTAQPSLESLSQSDGALVTSYATTATVSTSVTLDDAIYTCTDAGEVIALVRRFAPDHSTSLMPRWRRSGLRGCRSPAGAAQVLYLATASALVALDTTNGGELWRWDFTSPLITTPVIVDGRVFVATDRDLYAFALPALNPEPVDAGLCPGAHGKSLNTSAWVGGAYDGAWVIDTGVYPEVGQSFVAATTGSLAGVSFNSSRTPGTTLVQVSVRELDPATQTSPVTLASAVFDVTPVGTELTEPSERFFQLCSGELLAGKRYVASVSLVNGDNFYIQSNRDNYAAGGMWVKHDVTWTSLSADDSDFKVWIQN